MTVVNKRKNQGFSLPEVILIAAAISILIVFMAGNVTSFLEGRDENEEESKMVEIERAMAAFAEDDYSLPIAADMAASFASFSNLTAQDIAIDKWDRPREYRMFSDDITYRYAEIEVFYGVLYGLGADGCVGDTTVCLPFDAPADITAEVDDFLDVDGDADFDRDDFEVVEALGDDFLIKYTDLATKKDKYQVTERRLRRVAEALNRYAQTRYYGDVADDVSNSEILIYYPPSGATDQALYGADVWQDTADVLPALQDTFSTDPADNEARRDSMIRLMNLLALPESYCCNALTTFDVVDASGTVTYEEPFFYYSHPRVRLVNDPVNAGDCIAHEVAVADQLAERKLPARITVREDVCG